MAAPSPDTRLCYWHVIPARNKLPRTLQVEATTGGDGPTYSHSSSPHGTGILAQERRREYDVYKRTSDDARQLYEEARNRIDCVDRRYPVVALHEVNEALEAALRCIDTIDQAFREHAEFKKPSLHQGEWACALLGYDSGQRE